MTFAIFHNDREVARVVFEHDQSPELTTTDGKTSSLISKALQNGVTALRDLWYKSVRLKVEELVKPNHLLFPLAFKQWLERQGFEVIELHPETDEEINHWLQQLPDQSLRQKIVDWLRSASYLEKTYLLEKLRPLDSKPPTA